LNRLSCAHKRRQPHQRAQADTEFQNDGVVVQNMGLSKVAVTGGDCRCFDPGGSRSTIAVRGSTGGGFTDIGLRTQ
jgi:hypothetical protein